LKSFFAALTRHPLSLAGTAIATAAAILFLTFFTLDIFGLHAHPYFGILAYLIVPALFVFGLVLIPIGLGRARKSLAPREPSFRSSTSISRRPATAS
jgi:hypothetical protein